MNSKYGFNVWSFVYLNWNYVSVLVIIMNYFWFLVILVKFGCFISK